MYLLTYSEWMDMDSVLVLTCLLTYFEWMDMYGVLIPEIHANQIWINIDFEIYEFHKITKT